MNIEKLKLIIDLVGIRKDVITICASPQNESYCIENNHGKWSVFYSERGLRTAERYFDSEKSACRHFLKLLLNDPTVFSD